MSPNYVPDPVFVSIAAGVVCIVVVTPFMFLFDHVSDTILFTFAFQRKRDSLKPGMVAELGALTAKTWNKVWCTSRDSKDEEEKDAEKAKPKEHPANQLIKSQPPATQAFLRAAQGKSPAPPPPKEAPKDRDDKQGTFCVGRGH